MAAVAPPIRKARMLSRIVWGIGLAIVGGWLAWAIAAGFLFDTWLEWSHAALGGGLIALALGAVALAVARPPSQRAITELANHIDRFTSGAPAPNLAEEDRLEWGPVGAAFVRMQSRISRLIQELDQDRRELQAVFRCMAEGVIVIDGAQQVQFINEAACQLLRLPSESCRGRKLWELVRHRPFVEAAEAVLRDEEPHRKEFELTGRDERVLALHGSSLAGASMPGAVLVLQDVSELRRLERMRQDFVANVSHELKTPLAAIQALVETLLDGAIHDAQHNIKFLERVRENSERLSFLVQDLLTLNRIQSGQETLDVKPLELAPIIEQCVQRQEHRALAKQQQLVVEPAATPVVCRADEDALHHMLDNLVDNAIKYTPEGGLITLRWRQEGEEAVVEVADPGPGIPEKDLPRVFERFYRVDKARSRELGGTGLGLAIVKNLAQALSGRVTARSAIGVGSTFRIDLPAVSARRQPVLTTARDAR
ncbi:MAG TPA: ATP-binding protein [Gemmatales bacterium]|nr:ATP-binding protein [Gemmatales bacterium]